VHATKVLKEDHDRIAALLHRLEGDDREAPRLLDLLEKEITVHTLAEDNVFLPQVEEAVEDARRTGEVSDGQVDALEGAEEAIADAYENHREILSLLADRGPRDGIGDLKALMERQTGVEEWLHAKAETVLEDEDLERIGDLIEHCKWQVRGLAQAKLASSSSFRPTREEAVLVEGRGPEHQNQR
jgi:hypothetical protein